MVLTRDFRETIRERANEDPGFRAALLEEAAEYLLSGDVEGGKLALRTYIKATVGFEELAKQVKLPSKSLIRMFGPNGNPRASNLFSVLEAMQKLEGVQLQVSAYRPVARKKTARRVTRNGASAP